MKRFKNYITDYHLWTVKIWNPMKGCFIGLPEVPSFLKDNNFYTSEMIFENFTLNFGDKIIRFSTPEQFNKALILLLKDKLPELYVKCTTTANTMLANLIDSENWGDNSKTTNDSLSKNSQKQGIPPSQLKVKDDLAELNIKNAAYLENAIQNSTNTKITNILTNVQQFMYSNISGIVNDWLNNFLILFSPLLSSEFNWGVDKDDVLYDLKDSVDKCVEDQIKLDDKLDEIKESGIPVRPDLSETWDNNGYLAKQSSVSTIESNLTTINQNLVSANEKISENSEKISELESQTSSTKLRRIWAKANEVKIFVNLDVFKQFIKDNLVLKDGIRLSWENQQGCFSFLVGLVKGHYAVGDNNYDDGGSNIITFDNLPLKTFSFTLRERPGDYGQTPQLDGIQTLNVTHQRSTFANNSDLSRIVSMGNRSGTIVNDVFTFNYGSETQIPFEPEHQKLLIVSMLKDVYIEEEIVWVK